MIRAGPNDEWQTHFAEIQRLNTEYENVLSAINTSYPALKIRSQDNPMLCLISQGHSEDAQLLRSINLDIQNHTHLLENYCTRKDVYLAYLDRLRNNSPLERLWLGYKSAILYAQAKRITLCVWTKSAVNANELILNASHIPEVPSGQIIHGLHTDRLTHFNLLVEQNKPHGMPTSLPAVGERRKRNEETSDPRPAKRSRIEAEESTDNTLSTSATTGSFPITVTQKEFIPTKEPATLDYRSVPFAKAMIEAKRDKPETLIPAEKTERKLTIPSNRTELSDKAKIDIGKWGEHCVYLKLKAHYQEKYKAAVITEDDYGFSLKGKSVKGIEEQDIEILVKWHNKTKESYAPLDLEVTKTLDGHVIKHYIIEVKTTTSNHAHSAHFSEGEFKAMLEHKERYRIYRVFNAGSADTRIEKIKMPLHKIFAGQVATELDLKI